MMWTIKLLRVNHVPKDFREPFIVSGYRSCRSSLASCILSAFTFTNETINFWTHFLTSGVFLWMYTQWLWHELSFDVDPFTYPMQVYLASVCLYMIISSTAHLFNCMSERARHLCFFFDYGALSVYSMACSIMYNTYIFPKSFMNTTYHKLYLPMCVFNAFLCTVLACSSRLVAGVKRQKLLRMTAFATPYLFCSFPLFYRVVFCELDDCQSDAHHYHSYQFMMSATTILIYASHFPEVLAPGKFDIIGHSHQLFHIVGSYASYLQLQGNVIDMQTRRIDLLFALPMPSLLNTVGVILLVIIIDLLIIGAFTCFIWDKCHLRKVKQKQGIKTIHIPSEHSNNNPCLKQS
ncbi:membrane progestin receptor gamma-B-like [Asterias amurensis]|uniref:membrane progestin receptor gamma-B-like n=1 Tax=Asterias amurensis TaxID=7602 RepID=UPI003AB1F656